ncbi:hypothetical protein PHLGIDRAFT_32083 [Phlebiopsis gigantea 11061_1 CR5-6]|uniref:Smr domain-containing protein n=1 Tax=Phlebiopsis gigantea (strain 11061_1 CR5-6) TaxID=745531 RepID=A0A0C3RRJ8_PHLG1|nr:hypothetical protein PHLGIDRAFT_32083 [Phlebiopsis gigantea 11061_1 CR5-6]
MSEPFQSDSESILVWVQRRTCIATKGQTAPSRQRPYNATARPITFPASAAEFAPPLDTTLIAALVADYVDETAGEPSPTQIATLRRTLTQLAAQAEQDEDPVVDDFAQLQLSGTDDNTSTTDFFSNESSAFTTPTSTTSSLSTQSFSSPLGFLQAAFPHLPVSRLKSALGSAQDEDEVDMESVVNDILSSEFVKELEERGLEDEASPEGEWETAQPSKKKKRKAGKTVALVDIRQRQHVQTVSATRPAASDAWTQLSSVATHLEALLPAQTASYFLSFFHSPSYSTPSDALRAALSSMSASSSSSELQPDETQTLFLLFDVIRESAPYSRLPDIDRERMFDDTQLALCASHGSPDAALDLVFLLYELDAGTVDAVYHSPVPLSPSTMKSTQAVRLPAHPPNVAPPRLKTRAMTAPALSKPPPNAWKTVPVPPKHGPSPHAQFIPAYNPRKTAALKKKGSASHKSRASELEGQRREALREASRAWQRGNTQTRGGEVALYFAERARELQDQARKEKFSAAWDMVESKRQSTNNSYNIDLHGTTVAEAIQIAKDVLSEDPPTAVRPLKIITGRGKHSTNGVGVLGPAVSNALHEAGWNVAKFDGGLTVRGRLSRRP